MTVTGVPGAAERPSDEQRLAAEPRRSVWVTASAGTGKTRVLADRVLRLLLAGTHPERLLCLTFTKAAAAEMVSRIQKDLGAFATLAEADLGARLEALFGRPAAAGERARARTLFAEALDLPSGLPVRTIHAFCQSLLARFPLEAGVAPHFRLLEPRDAASLLRDARDEVLASADPRIAGALARLALLATDETLADLLRHVDRQRVRLRALVAGEGGGIEAVIGRIHTRLDTAPGTGVDDLRRAAVSDPAIDADALGEAAEALARGSETDRARGATIAAWLASDGDGRLERHDAYELAFLTGKRAARKSLATKQVPDPAGAVAAALAAEQERLLGWVEREKAAAIAARTADLLAVAWTVIEAYERRKAGEAALDFDDLIEASRRLLATPGVAAWVQYKLDQRIEHLLVDEGQDTSPAQWEVVTALVDDFWSGGGAHAGPRTLFVVGDEKQSIFSFLGADLANFQRVREALAARAGAGRHPWHRVSLSRSFRSTEPILELVDAVFEPEDVRAGVVGDAAPLRHASARAGLPGVVELWPLLPVEPGETAEAWHLPDEPPPQVVPERRLALAIAGRIQRWLAEETPLPATARPITPGDVMILLPRRGILQDQLVRALKQHNIPVAGVDRLALTDELPVRDLIALGDAVLLPEDDLTLAALLKSPLFGVDEEALFELAHARAGRSLHARLLELAPRRADLAAAATRFEAARSEADLVPPFAFFARILGRDGGMARFAARLGAQSVEPIEAFLSQALAYERSHPPSLQGFLHWLRADAGELARDPAQPRDEVRVLTVHGAKGLQAPIVFLADTTTVPPHRDPLVWDEASGLPLWKPRKEQLDRITGRASEATRRRQLEEQRRLLYVALTRAGEWLIAAGWQKRGNDGGPTWHAMIEAGMVRAGAARVPFAESGVEAGEGWRLAKGAPVRPEAAGAPARAGAVPAEAGEAVWPAWLTRAAPEEAAAGAPLSPSHLGEEDGDDEPPAASPVMREGDRYRRGRLIHRLLQILPEQPPESRAAALERWLARPGLGLADGARAEIAHEVRAVLEAEGFAAVFGPGSRAEVPLVGRIGRHAISGQIDRLVVTDREVLTVDYKTNREPPSDEAAVPRIYWRQMAAYRALLRRLYPGREVRCALLWTREPRLMPLDPGHLATHEPPAG